MIWTIVGAVVVIIVIVLAVKFVFGAFSVVINEMMSFRPVS